MFAVRLGLAVSLLAAALQAQPPRSAAAIVESAQTTAAAQHKTVFLIFHASW